MLAPGEKIGGTPGPLDGAEGMLYDHLPELVGFEVFPGFSLNTIQDVLVFMPEDGSALGIFTTSGFDRAVLAGFPITVFITDGFAIFLFASVIRESLTRRAVITILLGVIAELIRKE